MNLLEALKRDKVLGENGMPALKTSGMYLLDAFYRLGALRHATDQEILKVWKDAFAESPMATILLAFYNRDIRGGQGERRTFRIFFTWLAQTKPELAAEFIEYIPMYGRWDDLWLTTFGTDVFERAASFVASALKAGDKLCGKWMPREGKSRNDIATAFMEMWELTPRQYRKLCASNTDVIETKMCGGKWSQINYSSVPSVASLKYRKAFYRHDDIRYKKYLDALEKGVRGVKVNAGAIYPHTIVETIAGLHPTFRSHYFGCGVPTREEVQLANAQWKALPNFVAQDDATLVVGDFSGSMGMNGGLPFRVCLGLSLYLSERLSGPFKNTLITFSERPTFMDLGEGSLSERLVRVKTDGWDMNTNLEAVFNLILNTATQYRVPEKDMVKTVLILSDMQFDACITGKNALDMIDAKYKKAGYNRPKLVFWNLRDAGNVPVKYDTKGTALVSGFSPSIMTTVFKGANPLDVLLATLTSERYANIRLF